MISMVSSDPVSNLPTPPKDASIHPLPLANKDAKSSSTRRLMYKTSPSAADLSPSLLDSFAPTLSESSNLPSSEEEPISVIPQNPPKPAKPALKLVKPAESPAKSALKPALKSARPAGKSEVAKTPAISAETPKSMKLPVKPPVKPTKSMTQSTKLPPSQAAKPTLSLKLPPSPSMESLDVSLPATIVDETPANSLPAKTPVPAESKSPSAVTVEMVQEMVVSLPRL